MSGDRSSRRALTGGKWREPALPVEPSRPTKQRQRKTYCEHSLPVREGDASNGGGTVSNFEFAFTLFGLVLGLALAEVLGGFVRVLKARSATTNADLVIRIGWQTPMLALVVTLDLISFWYGAWLDKDGIPVNFASLVVAAGIAGIYFAAASLVFPDAPANWPDLDDWFARHKVQVAAGIFSANLLVTAAERAMFGSWFTTNTSMITQISYLGIAFALIFAKPGWQSVASMTVLLGLFAELVARPFY
jgi:hypothetical protein